MHNASMDGNMNLLQNLNESKKPVSCTGNRFLFVELFNLVCFNLELLSAPQVAR